MSNQEVGQVTFATFGATGVVGGRVAARLAEAGVGQRLVVRDRSRVPELAGAEVTEASYADPAALREALAGTRIFFMVSGAEDRERLRQHKEAVDAAVDVGVERIVYLSFLGAAPDATFTFARDHYHTEQHIRATDLGFTFCATTGIRTCCPRWSGRTASSADRLARAVSGRSHVTTWQTRPSRSCSGASSTTDGPTT